MRRRALPFLRAERRDRVQPQSGGDDRGGADHRRSPFRRCGASATTRWLVRGSAAAGPRPRPGGLGGLTVEHGLHSAPGRRPPGLGDAAARPADRAAPDRAPVGSPPWTAPPYALPPPWRRCCCSRRSSQEATSPGPRARGRPTSRCSGSPRLRRAVPDLPGRVHAVPVRAAGRHPLTHRLFMYLTAIAVVAMTAMALYGADQRPAAAGQPIPPLPARTGVARLADPARGAERVARRASRTIVAYPTLATVLWATVVQAGASVLAVPAGARRSLQGAGNRDPGGHRLTAMESATNTGELAKPIRAPLAARRPLADVLRDYLALTKPRIIACSWLPPWPPCSSPTPPGRPWRRSSGRCSGYLAAGGAGAINHYLERDRDARMARTCGRPWSPGASSAPRPVFGIALGALAIAELTLAVNALLAALALAGLLGYVFVYTLWLKPLTPQNIVIGARRPRAPTGRLGGAGCSTRSIRSRSSSLDASPPGPWPCGQGRLRAQRRSRCSRSPRARRRRAPDPRLQPGSGGVHGDPVLHRPVRSALPCGGAGARYLLRRSRGAPGPAPLARGRGSPPTRLPRLPGAPVLRDGGRPGDLG